MRQICILFLCAACSSPFVGQEISGADEFVLDSYKIRQGKFSILEMSGIAVEELDPKMLEEVPDRVQEGDRLNIVLLHPRRPDLCQMVQGVGSIAGFSVSGGMIRVPDFPPVRVAGFTMEEAGQALKEAFRKEVGELELYLSYREKVGRKVELAGLVQIANAEADGKLRLFDLLSRAKIPPEANLFKSYLLRQNEVVPVDFHKLMREGDMSQNLVMKGGDKIYIAESGAASALVLGEVGMERAVPLLSGYMPLRQVLAEAKGIPYTGDRTYIQVIRGSLAKPRIYAVTWEQLVQLPGESMLVMPGDIVYVSAKPIAEWNRFVSQIMPTVSALDAMRGTWDRLKVFNP